MYNKTTEINRMSVYESISFIDPSAQSKLSQSGHIKSQTFSAYKKFWLNIYKNLTTQ